MAIVTFEVALAQVPRDGGGLFVSAALCRDQPLDEIQQRIIIDLAEACRLLCGVVAGLSGRDHWIQVAQNVADPR